MRFIHAIIDDLRSLPNDAVSPMAAAVEELLGGERGSLADLAARFTQFNMGHIMASWIGGGPRDTISVGELRRVLGGSRVEDLATLAGLTSTDFLRHLVRVLPAAVHHAAAEATAAADSRPPIG